MYSSNRDKNWESYYRAWLFGKKTLGEIADLAGVSTKTIQRRFDDIEFDDSPLKAPQKAVPLVIDATFFGREWGLFCFHDTCQVVHVIEIKTEGAKDLRKGLRALKEAGYHFTSVTLDGKVGFAEAIRKLYPNLPVQMCHFHQQATVRRHLRASKNHPAKQELAELMLKLRGNPQEVIDEFYTLYLRHQIFINQKKENGKYQHKKLRSAFQSIQNNLPNLFIYKEISWVKIPNTTNHLEGAFAHMKKSLALHQGLNIKNKKKAAIYLLKHKNLK